MLIDTSGLLAFFHEDEPAHAAAHELIAADFRLLTHSYVLSEFVTLAYSRGLPRMPVVHFATELLDFASLEIVWIEGDCHRAALRLLAKRLDKGYSLCDAVSFVLMRQRRISDALTTDHHFEQEGFRRLL
jgi:uncharacterized protein